MEKIVSLQIWNTLKDSIRDVLQRMILLIKGGFISAVAIAVVFMVGFITIALSLGYGLADLFNMVVSQLAVNNSFSIYLTPETSIQKIFFVIITIGISLVSMYIVSRYVIFAALAITHTEKTFKELFLLSSEKVYKLIGLILVLSTIITFTTIPFVIPGLVYALALSLSIFPIIHENKGIKESLIFSSQITKGSKRRIFLLYILVGLIAFASQIVLMLYSSIIMFILQAFSKLSDSSVFLFTSFILLFVLIAAGFVLLAIFNTVLPLAVFQRVYNQLRQKDVTHAKGVRIWSVVTWLVIGLLLFSGLFLLARDGAIAHEKRLEKSYALNNLNKAKLKGYRAQLMTDLFSKGYKISETQKSKTYIGNGLSFSYPSTWKYSDVYTQSTNTFATFRFEDNKDSSLGIIKFKYNIELDPLVTWDSYQFLKTYGVSKLDEEVHSGGIDSYQINKLEGVENVTMLDIVQTFEGATTKEREYFWFIGPNKYTIGVFGEDNTSFAEACADVEKIIKSAVLDSLIQNYPEIYR